MPGGSPRLTAAAVKRTLREHINPEKAAFYPKFFKSGPGEYAEGDRFLGVTVPHQRKVARQFRGLPQPEIIRLLDDAYHECRLTGLLVMVEQYQRGTPSEGKQIVALYLKKIDRVNHWDLVDATAHKLLGPHLETGDRRLLDRLVAKPDLWRPRIAIIATLHFIKQGSYDDTLRLADRLLDHPHDLIHKAVGWMLREVGKQDRPLLEGYLSSRYQQMPRTMLRYAIERFPERRRQAYLRGNA